MSARPRGFIEWTPRRESAELLDAVLSVLDEYRAHLPLTLRQVYYRLVARGIIGKTEKDYARLCEHANRGRRAQRIPFWAIRDDGAVIDIGGRHETADDVIDSLKNAPEWVCHDPWRSQPSRVILWCEAAGMVPQLRQAVKGYAVPVSSSGGFDSVTVKHDMAQKLARFHAVTVLHLGDLDPSGVHVFTALREDIQAFAGYSAIDFVRLAVTADQVEEMNLPTDKPKASDNREYPYSFTCQCEAIDPAKLAEIVREAVEDRIQTDVWNKAIDRERADRAKVAETLRAAGIAAND
jgi:hypothetical protein